jgi:hypothetical protein
MMGRSSAAFHNHSRSMCCSTLLGLDLPLWHSSHHHLGPRGTQFTSSIWSQLSSFLHISHITTTAFHPQSNGMVERFHRGPKDTLRARCSSPDWVAHLSWCPLAFRSSPHELSNSLPAEAVFGTLLVLPGEFPASPEDNSSHFLANLSTTLSGSQASSPAPPPAPDIPLSHDSSIRFHRFPHCFLFQLDDHQETVSVSRLKPAYLPPNTLSAQPPMRGRPPLPKLLPSILKKPSKLSSKPSSVLCLPLDHRGLGNFLHVFQISSWNEILGGGEPCREPRIRPEGDHNKFINRTVKDA